MIRLTTVCVALLAALATPARGAVFNVDDTADDVDLNPGDGICATIAGTCTLRAAVMEANRFTAPPTDDEILLPAGLYRLTIPHVPRDFPSSLDGDLAPGSGQVLVIRGAGADVTIIEQTTPDRIFKLSGADVTIEDVTLRGGRALDPIDARLDPRDVGGAISIGPGRLTMRRVVVTDNRARVGGGIGGGGFITLENCQFLENEATQGGGAMALLSGDLRMVLTTISGNSGPVGGGIYFGGRGENFHIALSRISGNESLGTFDADGNYLDAGIGGGIAISTPVRTFDASSASRIDDTTVRGNVAAIGGGINTHGVDPLSLLRSTVSDNTAVVHGGAIRIRGLAVIENSTISGNEARYGGGVALIRLLRPGTRTAVGLRHSTLANNRATGGIGSGLFVLQFGDIAQAIGTIFDNLPPDRNCNINIDSVGSNLETGMRCGLFGPGDFSNTDPLLESLGDNGGATETHALGSGSPAIDSYTTFGCPSTDQRLALRPAGPACDIGSFEDGANPSSEFPGEPVIAPGEIDGGDVSLTLDAMMMEATSAEGISLFPTGPADGKDGTFDLPTVAGYAAAEHLFLVQRGGIGVSKGQRSALTGSYLIRLEPEEGFLWSLEPLVPKPSNAPFFDHFDDFPDVPKTPRLPRASRPLPLLGLEPLEPGQSTKLHAHLTKLGAHYLNHRLQTRIFKPHMPFGEIELAPGFAASKPANDPQG